MELQSGQNLAVQPACLHLLWQWLGGSVGAQPGPRNRSCTSAKVGTQVEMEALAGMARVGAASQGATVTVEAVVEVTVVVARLGVPGAVSQEEGNLEEEWTAREVGAKQEAG